MRYLTCDAITEVNLISSNITEDYNKTVPKVWNCCGYYETDPSQIPCNKTCQETVQLRDNALARAVTENCKRDFWKELYKCRNNATVTTDSG